MTQSNTNTMALIAKAPAITRDPYPDEIKQLRAFAVGYLQCNSDMGMDDCPEWDAETEFLGYGIKFVKDSEGVFVHASWVAPDTGREVKLLVLDLWANPENDDEAAQA